MCRKSAGVNMHSSRGAETPASLLVSLLSTDMQAPGLALLPRKRPGQWGSAQACRDHGSIRAGQTTCLPTSFKGHHNTLVCSMVLTSSHFPKFQEKNGLELLELGLSQPSVSKGNYTEMPSPEALARCTQPDWHSGCACQFSLS